MEDLVYLLSVYIHEVDSSPITLVGGPEGLRSLTNTKAIMVDRWPSFIQTSIPKVLDYPMRSLYQSW